MKPTSSLPLQSKILLLIDGLVSTILDRPKQRSLFAVPLMGGGSSKSTTSALVTEEVGTQSRRDKVQHTASRRIPESKPALNEISAEETELLNTVLGSFSFIPRGSDLLPFIRMLHKETLKAGSVVVSEGSEGNKLFIVSSGQLTATVEDEFLRTINAGDSFGELSLLYNTHYAMKVVVSSPAGCTIFSMFGNDYRHIHVIHPQFNLFLSVLLKCIYGFI